MSEKEVNDNVVEEEVALPDQRDIDAIIRKRVYGAVAVGMVPVPVVDFVGLVGIQIELVRALSKAYGVEFKEKRTKAIVTSLFTGLGTALLLPLGASLLKAIPLIGQTAGAVSVSVMSGAATYAVGSVFDRHFQNGGTIVNLDADAAKGFFKEKLEEGKSMAANMKKGKKAEATS